MLFVVTVKFKKIELMSVFKKLGLTFIFLMLVSVVLAQSGKKKKSKNDLTEEQHIALEKTFVNANKEKILGNDAQALELFDACIKIDENNAASMYEKALLLKKKKNYTDGVALMETAVKIDPENEWYLQLYGELLQRTGNNKEAIKVYNQLVELKPNNPEYYLMSAGAYLDAEKYEKAIEVFDELETRFGVDPDIIKEKQRIWLKLNKVDKAADELNKLIAKYPDEPQYYLMLIDLYSANMMYDKELVAIQQFQKVMPNHPAVALSMAEYYRSQGQKEKSFEELKKAFANPALDSELKAKVLISYVGLSQRDSVMMEQALVLSKIFVETNGDEITSHAMYADFLYINKQPSEARDQYRAAIKLDKSNLQLWQQVLQCSAEMNDYKTLADDSKEAISLFPDQPSFYYFNGVSNSILKNSDEAIKSLKTGYKLVVDNDNLLAEFYSSLGDNYNNIKDYKESDNFYEKALKINPKNIAVLNNWAYYLSLRKANLDKAADMSKYANELSPDNGTYQDTYAWVLFQQGKYTDALEWQDKALKNTPENNGTLLEHYGDILFKLGQTEKAVEYWNKAKATGEGSDQLNKKIAERKYFE